MEHKEICKEEIEKQIEKAKKALEEALARMTPEERAEAEKRFAALLEADEAERRKTVEDARKVLNETATDNSK